MTVEEQQEKVDGLNEKISTLKTEYDELSGKGNLTDQEQTRLEMLERQLDIQNELYKIEMKRLAEKDLHGTGDIFSDGNLVSLNADVTGNGKFIGGVSSSTSVVKNIEQEVNESLTELERVRELINTKTRDQWTHNYTWQEQNAVDALKSQREDLLEQWQAYSDSYELIKKHMDEGVWDNDSAEKEKYQGLMGQYQTAMDELQALVDKTDIALGLKIDIEPAKDALKEALKDKEGFSKGWIESLSEEEISLLYRLEDVGDKSIEEINALIEETRDSAENGIVVDTKTNASSTLSQLEQLSDGFDKFSAIYEDVRNKQDFDFGSLIDEDFATMFEGMTDEYNKFVSVISSSPTDINACQSAFDDLVSAWFYGQAPLKNITEETKDLTVAWLEQKGIANAVEIADYALAESKKQAFIDTHSLKESTVEEIQVLLDEAEAAGFTGNAMYDLALAVATADDTALSFEQQINAIYDIATAAGLANDELNKLVTAGPMIASKVDLNLDSFIEANKNGTLAEWERANQAKQQVTRLKDALNTYLQQNRPEYKPTARYSPKTSSSSKSSSSGSGSSSEKEPHVVEVDKYKNLSDAVDIVESKISRLNETFERTYDTERKIALNNDLINLYKEKQDAITTLNKARDEEIKGLVALLREQKFDIEYNPDTDRLLIKNRAHINEISQDVIETYEDYLNRIEELNDANKESGQQWHELAYAIQDTKGEIHELNLEQYDKQIDDLKQVYDHTDNLKEQIALNQVLIKLYQEQRDELLRINQSRDDEIARNVEELRSVGIDISYDQNTDNLEIKNREQLNKLSETAQVKYRNMVIRSEELADANKKGSERWKELTYAIAETGDEIDELNHKRFEEAIADAEHMIALMANRKDTRGKDLVLYEQMMNDVLKRREDLIADGYQKNKAQIQELERQWIDLYDTRLEREKELLEMQLDDKDGVLAAVTNKIDEQIEGLDEQTKAIDKQIESMQKVNEEHKKALDYQKAQAALDKARNQRTRLVLRKGKGWVYEADQDAIKDAEETFADLKYETAIDILEKQKEALEKQKEALEEYKNLWAEIPKEYENYQNELLAEQELGADWEQKILDGRLDVYTDFKDDYFNLQDDIWAKTDELENHMNEAYLNMVRTFQLMASLNTLHEQYTGNKQSGTTNNRHWYVQQNGKAPAEAQVNDIVYTKGGTYRITAKDENGKFTSEKINDTPASILDDMWGKEVNGYNVQMVNAIGQNTRSNQDILDATDREIEERRNQIFATHDLTDATQGSIQITQDQVAALLKNMGMLDGNSISVDDNTVTIGENTYALEDVTDALNNFDLAGQMSSVMGVFDFGSLLGSVLGTTQLPTGENLPENIEAGLKSLSSKLNPFDAYDFSKLTGDNKAYYEQLKEAYKTTVSQENAVASSQILSQLAGLIIDSGMTANDMSDEYAKLLAKQDPYSRTDPLTGLSTKFTEDSKSNAYKGGTVAAVKGTTKTIWGLDASNKEQVDNLVNSGVLTKEEANNLVQISGRNIKSTDENTNANTYSGDGAYYAGDSMQDAADRIEDSNDELGDRIEKATSNMSVNVNISGSYGMSGSSDSSGIGKSGGSSSIKTGTTSNGTKITTAYYSNKSDSKLGSKSSSSSNKNTTKKATPPKPKVTIKKKAHGGLNLPADIYNVDEKGAEMIVEPDEGRYIRIRAGGNIVPADVTKKLWEMGKDPQNYIAEIMTGKLMAVQRNIPQLIMNNQASSGTVNHYHFDNMHLHDIKDVDTFASKLPSLALKAEQYCTRR